MTETSLLQGEITENPHEQELDVEGLLLRFIRSLVAEQTGPNATSAAHVIPASLPKAKELAPDERAAVANAATIATTSAPAPLAAAGGTPAITTSAVPAGTVVVQKARLLSLVRPQSPGRTGDRA